MAAVIFIITLLVVGYAITVNAAGARDRSLIAERMGWLIRRLRSHPHARSLAAWVVGGAGSASTEIAAAMLRYGQEVVVVPAAGTVTIGRGGECDVRVDDPMMSHRHLIVRDTAAGVVVEDLGSSNGTWVNGQRFVATRCIDGDVIRAGQTRLTLQVLRLDAAKSGGLGATQRRA